MRREHAKGRGGARSEGPSFPFSMFSDGAYNAIGQERLLGNSLSPQCIICKLMAIRVLQTKHTWLFESYLQEVKLFLKSLARWDFWFRFSFLKSTAPSSSVKIFWQYYRLSSEKVQFSSYLYWGAKTWTVFTSIVLSFPRCNTGSPSSKFRMLRIAA